MIECAGRPVTHLELTKWAFLLSQEMPTGGGSVFYDFLPYRFGPFSFLLFREIDNLVRDGYLKAVKVNNKDAWARMPDVPSNARSLSGNIRSDAARVVERFVDSSPDKLLDYVYDTFPWYTANSELRQLEQRRIASPAVYTVGYEGWSVDRLLNELMRHGIERIIDVRRNPVARRYGFHKTTLSRIAGKVNIEYVHFPQLGIPGEMRHDLDGIAAYERLFDRYIAELLPREPEALSEVAKLIKEKPSVLMCMEADPAMCHRTHLAAALSPTVELSVRHLRGQTICKAGLN